MISLSVWGTLLKVLYLAPFLSYYLIIKRYNRLAPTKAYKYFMTGFLLVLINIIIVIITIFGGEAGFFGDKLALQVINPWAGYLIQIISNLLLIISYSLLLVGLGILTNEDLLNLFKNVLFVSFLLSIIAVSATSDIYLIITLITYPLATFILALNFILMYKLQSRIDSLSKLMLIATSLILIDAVIYFGTYNYVLTSFDSSTIYTFLSIRNIAYLVSLTAVTLAIIPNAQFLFQLLKKNAIIFSDKDSEVDRVIKCLSIQMQKIYGKVTLNMFNLACKEFKKYYGKEPTFNNTLNINNLDYTEQKELLRILVSKYYEVIGKTITNSFLNKIAKEGNKKLINDAISGANELLIRRMVRDKVGSFLKENSK